MMNLSELPKTTPTLERPVIEVTYIRKTAKKTVEGKKLLFFPYIFPSLNLPTYPSKLYGDPVFDEKQKKHRGVKRLSFSINQNSSEERSCLTNITVIAKNIKEFIEKMEKTYNDIPLADPLIEIIKAYAEYPSNIFKELLKG